MHENHITLLIIVDEQGWSFDNWVTEIMSYLLRKKIAVEKCYRSTIPERILHEYIYVCWWADIEIIKSRIKKNQKILCRITDMVTWNESAPHTWESRFRNIVSEVYCFIASSIEIQKKLLSLKIQNVFIIGDCVSSEKFRNEIVKNTDRKPTIGWCGNPTALEWMQFNDIKGFKIVQSIKNLSFFDLHLAISYPHKEIPRWFQNIDIYLCASKSEGTPLTVLEALASGCIILSTAVGIIPEIKSEGVFIFDGSRDNLVHTLFTLCSIKEKWSHLKYSNRKEFENNWSTDIIGKKYYDWLKFDNNCDVTNTSK